MSRLQEIIELSEEILAECFERNLADLQSSLEQHRDEYVDGLAHVIQAVIHQTVQMQQEKKKGRIVYLSISLPLSSILTERYGLGVHLYSEDWFLDETEAFQIWYLPFLNSYVEQDLQAIEPVLKANLIRLKSYELLEFKRVYVFHYLEAVLKCLPEWIISALEQVSFDELQCSPEMTITFGLYMEKQKVLCRWGKVR